MKLINGYTETSPVEYKKQPGSRIEWQQPVKKSRGEDLLKNIGTSAALLVCLVMLRNGAVSDSGQWTDAVLAAAADDTLLDDRLGRLSFVSTLFPEAVLVFGESNTEQPEPPIEVSASIHAWSEQEPYVAWMSDSTCVFAAISGEVMGVYHGMNEEMMIQITNDQQLSCIAGNLRSVNVDTGDCVMQGDLIGWIGEGSFCSFEVQQNGRSINPALLMEEACSDF